MDFEYRIFKFVPQVDRFVNEQMQFKLQECSYNKASTFEIDDDYADDYDFGLYQGDRSKARKHADNLIYKLCENQEYSIDEKEHMINMLVNHGFYLKRMERQNPVLILEPGKTYKREDGTVGNYYNAKKLYDISQTTMSDTTIQKSEYEEHDLIRALVSTPPVNIVAAEPEQMPDEKGAFFKPEEGCICVRKGMSAQEIFQNLVPELVFAGYADGNPHYDKNEDAFHVSCASYMLCKKYGMDTSRYNFLHAPEFFEKMETQEVRVELSRARNAANAISARMAKVLDQNRNATYRQSEAEKNGQDSSENVKDKKENPEPEKKEQKSRGQHRKEAR